MDLSVFITEADSLCILLTQFIRDQIRDSTSAVTVAQLLFLEAEDAAKPIHMYINSPGGSVTAGLAIYDTVSACIFWLLSGSTKLGNFRCRFGPNGS